MILTDEGRGEARAAEAAPVATMRSVSDALSAWRAAERRLAMLPLDSPGTTAIATEIERLRARYQELVASGRPT